jgi:CheY-like chemotaxis protein/MinD-like ATPase involved in chromosome partitioning or flagellar assembly
MAEKILIVDDDMETLRLVGLMLQRQGYQILAANSGKQALTMAGSEHPDAILLDVMMPDMDGYEVTRALRKMPEAASIPIMMFTAKSMVDDRVAGFEAGVDDYVTKPIHPAELVAHIKSMLARKRPAASEGTNERAHTIGFVSAKGGLGVSTMVLNLAICLKKKGKAPVTAAELCPGHGSWGIELGYAEPIGLNNLLRLKPSDINLAAVERELTQTSFGIHLLMASNRIRDVDSCTNMAQLEPIVQELTLLGGYLLLDIGCALVSGMERVLRMLDEVVIMTEPFPSTVQRTRLLIDDLQSFGFSKNKLMTVVMYNRMRTESQMTITQVQDILAQPVPLAFPPAPETAFNASMRSIPIVNLAPESTTAMQFNHMAELIAQRVNR